MFVIKVSVVDQSIHASVTETPYSILLLSEFILSPIAAKNSKTDDPITQYIKSNKTEKSDYEDTRILYVACTRAKKRLYLSANFDRDDDGNIKPADKSAFVSKLWPVFSESMQFSPSVYENETKNLKEQPSMIKVLPPSWRFDAFQDEQLEREYAFDNTDFNLSESWNELTNPKRSIGIVIHSVLQLYGEFGVARCKIKDLSHFIETRIRAQGIGAEQVRDQALRIFRVFEKLECDEDFNWIFADSHLHAKNEWSLWQLSNNGVSESIIDRSFVEDSTRWVIDYKTAVPDQGQSIESFLAEQRACYEDQLRRYRRFVMSFDKKQTHHVEIREFKAGLYFPLIQHFVHCEDLDANYE